MREDGCICLNLVDGRFYDDRCEIHGMAQPSPSWDEALGEMPYCLHHNGRPDAPCICGYGEYIPKAWMMGCMYKE